MKSKLSLTLDQSVIERAKDYAALRGVSLAEIVERFLINLTLGEKLEAVQPSGLVAELAGLLASHPEDDLEAGYAEHLTKKYS
jgi:hypothetical protein